MGDKVVIVKKNKKYLTTTPIIKVFKENEFTFKVAPASQIFGLYELPLILKHEKSLPFEKLYEEYLNVVKNHPNNKKPEGRARIMKRLKEDKDRYIVSDDNKVSLKHKWEPVSYLEVIV